MIDSIKVRKMIENQILNKPDERNDEFKRIKLITELYGEYETRSLLELRGIGTSFQGEEDRRRLFKNKKVVLKRKFKCIENDYNNEKLRRVENVVVVLQFHDNDINKVTVNFMTVEGHRYIGICHTGIYKVDIAKGEEEPKIYGVYEDKIFPKNKKKTAVWYDGSVAYTTTFTPKLNLNRKYITWKDSDTWYTCELLKVSRINKVLSKQKQ